MALKQSVEARFWSKVDRSGGDNDCWEWMAGTFKGTDYGQFREGEIRWRAHRKSWEMCRGAIPEGKWVLHICPGGGNPRCVNPAHLYLGDQNDNERDKSKAGRRPVGDQHPRRLKPGSYAHLVGAGNPAAKLSYDQAEALRGRYAEGGATVDSLAREFRVSHGTVANILSGRFYTSRERASLLPTRPQKRAVGRPASPIEERFWSKVDQSGGAAACWPWLASRFRTGYGQFGDGPGQRLAHRMAWKLVNGPIPAGQVVRHRCDNPICVNPAHLMLGTQLTNRQECSARGRTGARNRSLTADQVRQIRVEWKAGGSTQREIGARYGIKQWLVSNIVRGKSYRQIE